MNETVKLSLTLTIICIVAGVSLAFVHQNLNPIILDNKLGELKTSLEQVLPGSDSFEETDYNAQSENILSVFKAIKGGEVIGHAILATAQGYGGDMKILIGIDEQGQVKGIRIIEHLETPGLGAKVSEAKFLDQFIGKSGKFDIDTITGATVSSNAVINTVKESIVSIEFE